MTIIYLKIATNADGTRASGDAPELLAAFVKV